MIELVCGDNKARLELARAREDKIISFFVIYLVSYFVLLILGVGGGDIMQLRARSVRR